MKLTLRGERERGDHERERDRERENVIMSDTWTETLSNYLLERKCHTHTHTHTPKVQEKATDEV